MDRSLEDIIKDNQHQKKSERKSGGGRGGAGGGGKVRGRSGREDRQVKPYGDKPKREQDSVIRQPFSQKQDRPRSQNNSHRLVQPTAQHFQHVNTEVPDVTSSGAGLSIFERIGTKKTSAAGPVVSGTSVTISNLNAEISIADLSELCSTIGEVKSVDLDIVSRPGAKKSGRVLFARRSDAITCVTKFNGLTLDGTKMVLELTGDGGKPNPFNPVDPEEEARQEAALRNKKTGLFGSALDGDDEHAGVTVPLRQPFSQHNKDRRPTNDRRVSHDGHDDRSSPQQHKHQQNGGGRGGGRGSGKAPGRGGGRVREQKPEPTSDQLDADMDAYFAAK